MKDKVLFYPVANGDTTLISLRDLTNILVDCKLRAKAEDPNDPTCFDVKQDLLTRISRRYISGLSIPFLDVFILTHPDKDHCSGFAKNFYTGDPSIYSKFNQDRNEVLIEELWVTSMLFTTEQSDDANALRKEANRRKLMKQLNDPSSEMPGNRIRLVGYDGHEKFSGVESYVPGTYVTKFNGSDKANFGMFIHAPFKDDLIVGKAEGDRNSTSIVFSAYFIVDGVEVCRLLMGGDADHYNWEQILDKSRENGNEDHLRFDLFLAPHHCSWTFFNDVPYGARESNKIPKWYSLAILDYAKKGAYIIASSKKISSEDQNPPHFAAKLEYLKKLDDKSHFLNTAVEPSEGEPKPIEFVIEKTGLRRLFEPTKDQQNAAIANIASSGFKPYGY